MVKIADTHLHSWDLGKLQYSWLTPEAGILYNTYLPGDLEQEKNSVGISAAILVQSDNSVEDTMYMFAQAKKHEWIKGVVAWLPLHDPEKTEMILRSTYLKEPSFKGVRHLMHLEKDNWLLQVQVLESLKILASHDIAFDAIGINHQQFESIIQASSLVPSLRVVIDHLNQPPLSDRRKMVEWKQLMKEASGIPSVHVKISGLGTIQRPPGMTLSEAIRPAVAIALETFGTQRCFCGGDWPISLMDASYSGTWAAYKETVDSIIGDSASDERILYDNATYFYRLGG